MGRIVDPLREMGVPIKSASGSTAPLTLSKRRPGERLKALSTSLPVASAQVKSAILLAALGADGVTEVEEPGPSRDHTERLLSIMGVEVAYDPAEYRVTLIPPPRPLRPLQLNIPGDISSGAFLIGAALIVPKSEITLHNVGLNPTRVGLLDALKAMGARIELQLNDSDQGEPVGDVRVYASDLHGIEVEGELVVRMIDEFPILAVVAAVAEGETVVRGAQELRFKESDRISALCRVLRAVGVDIEELPDGFRIRGRQALKGGAQVSSYGDHRLAMALSVAGLVAEQPIVLEDAEFITQSFPGFVEQLQDLGAEVTT
jgi:3-phosphoshikimate 1-carboxyvinyltransferase